MKTLILSLFLTVGLLAECENKEMVVFQILNGQLQQIQKIDENIEVDKSVGKISFIVERENILTKMQDTIYEDILAKKLSSKDPRVQDKLLSILKLVELINEMKKSVDSSLIGSFESELDNLKLLLNPQGVCPKMKKRPRKYNIEKYL